MHITDIKHLINNELDATDKLIDASLTTDVPLIKTVCEHLIHSGGKRLRPVIALLVARALGDCNERHHELAAIVEFIHTATLLHDDVIDESSLRRGKKTANETWGNQPSILVGDFLLSRTLQMMVHIQDMQVIKILADATNNITTGEMLQLTNRRNTKADETYYMQVIRAKTAVLFAAACEASALLVGADADTCQMMHHYGDALGVAFQLADDALDYAGSATALGKQVGDDLAEGKPTLPLIYAIANGDDKTKTLIEQALKTGHGEQLNEICQAVRDTGALDYTYQQAQRYADKAKDALQGLPDSDFKQALLALSDYAVARQQ